jgi:hypothetical protein
VEETKAETMIKVSIGDICVSIASPHEGIVAHAADRYHSFLSDRAPDFEIVMAFEGGVGLAEFLGIPRERLQGFTRRNLASEMANADWVQTAMHPHEAESRSPSSVEDRLESRPKVSQLGRKTLFQRSDFAAWVDVEAREGRSVLGRNMEPFAVESFLRICYSFLAVESSGLLLHSAGVIRDGKGYVFPGVSGTGKSTIATLATDRETVLSDELVVVRKMRGGYLVYSTPFYGTNESVDLNANVPLKAAFLPVKDSEVYARRAKPSRALAKLLSSVLFFGQEAGSNQRLMDISADIVAQIPFYDLHFRRDASFWECIGELENGG